MKLETILILICLIPWFFVGWVALFVLFSKSQPKRNLEDANQLLAARNKIGMEQADSMARIAAALEAIVRDEIRRELS